MVFDVVCQTKSGHGLDMVLSPRTQAGPSFPARQRNRVRAAHLEISDGSTWPNQYGIALSQLVTPLAQCIQS